MMKGILIAALVLLSFTRASAALVLPPLFGDNMVVQRGQKIHVWGWDSAGASLTLTLAGKSVQAQAQASGKWQAEFPPLDSKDPAELTIQGSETKVIKNILAGEVWLCSGQSNMEFSLKSAESFEEDKASFEDPMIRLFKTDHAVMEEPQSEVGGKWIPCGGAEAAGFSAVGLYFARRLRQELGVPVGLIQSAWGGTPIEAWMTREALESDPENKNYLEAEAQGKTNQASGPYEILMDDFRWTKAKKTKTFLDFESGDAGFGPGASDGSKAEASLAAGEKGGQSLKFSGILGPGGWVNLNRELAVGGKALDVSAFDGLEFRARGRGSLKVALGQESVKDWSFHRSKDLALTEDWQTFHVSFADLKQPDWGQVKQAFDPAHLTHFSLQRDDPNPPGQPACLYNGMVAPHAGFALQGALWYQGESNAWKAEQYARELKGLILSWRKAWGRDFSFYVVQLANFMGTKSQPGDSEWAELRESQLKALDLPNTGLAVAIDVGNPADIHPKNKKSVGERLARWALAGPYKKKITPSGPLYAGFEPAGSSLRLHFRYAEEGLKASDDGELKGFSLAGEDRVFHWAKAEIKGSSVLLTSTEVDKPVAARYAWDDSPLCNLVNHDDLPASPFRTDSWPGVTAGRR